MSDPHTLCALLGGTFDPIHYGHLRPAEALARQVALKKVTLIPNNVPPHRPQPEASAAQRAEMVRLAIKGNPLFDIDLRELRRNRPSYTIDTLHDLRLERGDSQPLAFIIGQDSLLSLPEWRRGRELLDFCHLLVCQRSGYPLQMADRRDQAWVTQHLTTDVTRLHQQPAGCIWLAQTPLMNISASEIRSRRRQGKRCDDLLPAAVSAFMDREGLYRDTNRA